MKAKIFFFAALFLLYGSVDLLAQKPDTLRMARSFNEEGRYFSALAVLDRYLRAHPEDFYSSWLRAHTLHLAGRHDEERQAYLRLQARYPGNNDIRLDFIQKTVEHGKPAKARQQITRLLHRLSGDNLFTAYKLLAQLYYWQGDYDHSYLAIKKALQIYPGESSARGLLKEIQRARSNWVELNAGYFRDDQVLERKGIGIAAGYYVSSTLTLNAGLSFPVYNFSDEVRSIPRIDLGGTLHFLRPGLKLELGVGAFGENNEKKFLLGKALLSKQVAKHGSFTVGYGTDSYLATVSSIKKPLRKGEFLAKFEFNRPKGLRGNFSLLSTRFRSIDNSLFTFGSWLLSPPLEAGKFNLRGGYGFNYSDSRRIDFVSVEPLDTILSQWDSSYVIEGIYEPVFTPRNQVIHSLVGTVAYDFSEGITAGVSINYGVVAHTDAPYLQLEESPDAGNRLTLGTERTTYHPWEMSIYLLGRIGEFTGFELNYKRLKTFYYTSNYWGLSLRQRF